MTEQDNKRAVTGKWEIVSWEQRFDDGRHELPMGEHVEGFILYTAGGDMMCMLARQGRKRFETGGQWSADVAEKAAAYESMLCYAGTYDVQGDVVSHHVNLSLFPNWQGGVQKRRVERMEGDTLVLAARLEDGTPQARTSRLIWRRAASE